MDLKERTGNPNRHPWELSRADMVLDLLRSSPPSTRYADIGSGDLYFAERLAGFTTSLVYAVDVNYGAPGVSGRVRICTHLDQVPSASIDCALLMDVMEHVADDAGLITATRRILAPGGRVLVTVPAHAFLWSEHDEFLGHHRRYNRPRLRAALAKAGFDVQECFYFYGIPFVARALDVALTRVGVRRTAPGVVAGWRYPAAHPVTKAVRALLNGDFMISRALGATPLPGIGLSICAICQPSSA